VKKIEISNWATLREQFGLTDSIEGVKSARQISKELTKLAQNFDSENEIGLAVECNTKSEAVCLFEFNSEKSGTIIFDYTGTAN